jgi:hypothetical protein
MYSLPVFKYFTLTFLTMTTNTSIQPHILYGGLRFKWIDLWNTCCYFFNTSPDFSFIITNKQENVYGFKWQNINNMR